MAGIVSKTVLDDIRFRCDIADVIDSYITLPRKGTVVKTICPFHKEKTPSFNVNRQRQMFHCFGCGAGGDVFKFVMMYEQVDFPGAVRILAEKAGVPLQFDKGSEPSSDKEILLAIHEESAALFHRCLMKEPMAQPARDYLRKRKLNAAIAEEFMIGYAPEQWDFVLNWAKGRSFPIEKLELAGLVVRKTEEGSSSSAVYDRFRNRVMFPIRNEQGRIVAFSGRTLLQDPKAAKYVNSPETPIFRKSHILYALDKARRDIVEKREAIVCEGQIDVIRCHQAGFKTAVAAQGTAFTEDHARILRRYADGVVLVFDSDEAGRNAALRATTLFMQSGLAVRIASLPQGEDPDSLILKEGPEGFERALQQAVPALDFQINLLLSREEVRSEAGLMRVCRAVLGTISQTPNAIQRDVLLQTAARRLNVSVGALQAELRPLLRQSAPREAPTVKPPRVQRPAHEVMLAEHLGAGPEQVSIVERYLPLTLIFDPLCRRFVEAMIFSHREHAELMETLTQRDDEDRSLSTFAAEVLSAPSKAGAEGSHRQAVEGLILGIWRTELQRRRLELEQQAAGCAEDDARDALMAQAQQLTTDLNRLKRWETGELVLQLYAEPALPDHG
jgi:DNA primase